MKISTLPTPKAVKFKYNNRKEFNYEIAINMYVAIVFYFTKDLPSNSKQPPCLMNLTTSECCFGPSSQEYTHQVTWVPAFRVCILDQGKWAPCCTHHQKACTNHKMRVRFAGPLGGHNKPQPFSHRDHSKYPTRCIHLEMLPSAVLSFPKSFCFKYLLRVSFV